MSTSQVNDDQVVDLKHEVPPSLGENPFKGYLIKGNVWVCKIINDSCSTLKYDNPNWKGGEGREIAPKQKESSWTTGYIPFWTESGDGPKYVVKYYHTVLKREVEVTITDLNRDWMVRFSDDGLDYDQEIQPVSGKYPQITLIFMDTGYKFGACDYGDDLFVQKGLLNLMQRHYPR